MPNGQAVARVGSGGKRRRGGLLPGQAAAVRALAVWGDRGLVGQAVARDGNVWEWRTVGPAEWMAWSSGNGTLPGVPPGSVEAIYASYVLQESRVCVCVCARARARVGGMRGC
jgi:hypothetical protein